MPHVRESRALLTASASQERGIVNILYWYYPSLGKLFYFIQQDD